MSLVRLVSQSFSSHFQHSLIQVVSVLLVSTEVKSERCRPSLKSTGEDKQETKQVAASRAAANEISTDAAVVALLSRLLCICTLKEEVIMALQALSKAVLDVCCCWVGFIGFCFCYDFKRGIATHHHSSPQDGNRHLSAPQVWFKTNQSFCWLVSCESSSASTPLCDCNSCRILMAVWVLWEYIHSSCFKESSFFFFYR